mmetsp:Transcript_3190/g.4947  ORF Transcript_3190/g.4947 Transcript_3190/m.4947 type:complete len:180 (-) Transcript_3190:63-602(-)
MLSFLFITFLLFNFTKSDVEFQEASRRDVTSCICKADYLHCNFYFEGYETNPPTYHFHNNKANPAFSSQILIRSGEIVADIASGDNFYLNTSNYDLDPIGDLDDDLRKIQFTTNVDDGKPKLGHKGFFNDARVSVQNQCIMVRFRSYEIVNSHGAYVSNVVSTSSRDCVVFKVPYYYRN